MPDPQELIGRIERCIQAATHGRVIGVHVEIENQTVVLHGRAATYYAKQLAQHATHEVIAECAIVNGIEVN